jgi:integrase
MVSSNVCSIIHTTGESTMSIVAANAPALATLERFMLEQGFDHQARAAAAAALAVAAPAPAVSWQRFAQEVLAEYAPALRAKSTLRSMQHALRQLEGLGIESPHELGDVRFLTRLVTSRDPKLSPNSVKGLLRRVQCVCTHALNFGYISASPFAARPIRTLVRGTKPAGVRHLTGDQVAKLHGLLDDDVRDKHAWALYQARRTRALVVLITNTGLRLGEALHAHVEDLCLDEGIFWVESRASHRLKTTSSAQFVIVAEPGREILRDWLTHRMDAPPGVDRGTSPYLFPNTRSAATPWVGGCTGTKPLCVLKAVGKRAGFEVTYQMLRRSTAVAMEAAGASAQQIKRQLRHSSVSTTETFYMAADRQGMTDAFKGFGYGS